MAPGPGPKGFPRPKMSLELAFAMLRLAPWLVLSCFKTDGWPPIPIPKPPQAQTVVGAGFCHAAAGALASFIGSQNGRMAPGPDPKGLPRPKMYLELALAYFYRISKLTDGPRSRSQRVPQAQNVVGAGFCHAAAGALACFVGFQNWRMAPCPDPKGLPSPKMYLELALAMLRLAPWLVLSGFKTDGWPPVPIPKASPGPKCSWSWLLPRCGWRPGWFYRVSKLTDGPLSRSQRLPQAQTVVGAGFCHAAAGALACFIGFQNWRMAPGPDPKGFPRPKMSLELALAMLRSRPGWFYRVSKLTDGPRSRSQRLPRAQNVFGAGFCHAAAGARLVLFRHAAAGALAGFIGFQNWRMAPGPDPKGLPRPMLRLAPWLVLSGFKTDGWPPVPIPKASPGPKCLWSWL